MSWNFSTGFKDQFLNRDTQNSAYVLGSTASVPLTFVDGGASADSITAASGLDTFAVDDWILIISPLNNNVVAKVLTASATTLTVATGTLTAEAAAAKACIMKIKGGSFKELMQNGTLYLYSGTRPTSADLVENGTLLAKITADGNSFVLGTSLNGLNFGNLTSSVLGIGDDPATATTEVWSGDGIVAGTATWGRFHANDGATGASTTEVRMDGNVTTTSGGDLVMASGRDIVIGVPAVVSEFNVGIFSSQYS